MLDPENLVGQTIGGCQITEKFAIGGMATIYKAFHERTGQVVAVKVLLRDLATDPVYVERFIREAKAASAVKHPNVTTVLDAGTVDNVHYFVMEFVEGAPLDATLAERGQLFWQDAIEIGIQIADALEQAHANGIIHRDIKPDNIIVMADGVAKLTDMGISKSLRPDAVGLTAPGIILGTPYYMSPEQAKDSRSVDQRSDIYGLGATLYHMLTGRPPVKGETEQDIVLNLLETDPAPVISIAPYVPKNVSRVLERMMAKNPQRRYQSMNEVLVDLKLVRDSQEPIFLNTIAAAPGVAGARDTRGQKRTGPATEQVRAPAPKAGARPAQQAAPATEKRAPAQQPAPATRGTTKRQGQQKPAPDNAANAPYRANAPTPVYAQSPVQQQPQSSPVEISPWVYKTRKRSMLVPIVTIVLALVAAIVGWKVLKKYTKKEDDDDTRSKSFLFLESPPVSHLSVPTEVYSA